MNRIHLNIHLERDHSQKDEEEKDLKHRIEEMEKMMKQVLHVFKDDKT